MFSTDTIYKKNPLVSWQKLDEQILIISEDNQFAHELNEVAAFCWERLDQKNMSDIINEISANFEVDASILIGDLEILINDLRNKKLVL